MQNWRDSRPTKFANLAFKVIMAQMKIPVIAGTAEALAMDALFGPLDDDAISSRHTPCAVNDQDEIPSDEEVGQKGNGTRSVPTTCPPAGDCSSATKKSSEKAPAATTAPV